MYKLEFSDLFSNKKKEEEVSDLQLFNFENLTQTIMKFVNCLILNLQFEGQQTGPEVIWAQVSSYVIIALYFK